MSKQYKYIDNKYVEFTPPKQKFWKRLLEKVVIFGIGLVIKNQKGIKGTPNEQRVDDLLK